MVGPVDVHRRRCSYTVHLPLFGAEKVLPPRIFISRILEMSLS